ncbi:MAG: sigma-70 family RNA polymerase sigma factor [Kiritimatiellae bacterium]|nr:sigma-70 family RNA polymerase sigma factor [Kiritimatiellia bacterium]MBR2941082.1 sigma-70 family RNA polymerase sigma factor [Kiritimatiellia bacterium]
MMDAYMRERFPFVEADDAIQETLIALIKTFPVYNYSPEETGAFHNYLTGILRNKALCQIERERRHSANLRAYADEMRNAASSGASPRLESSRRDIFEIALRQLLADKSVHELTREVFRRVAVNGEDPEEVASDIGKTRNAVYQMKDRMMTRLKGFVAALEKVEAEQNGRG